MKINAFDYAEQIPEVRYSPMAGYPDRSKEIADLFLQPVHVCCGVLYTGEKGERPP